MARRAVARITIVAVLTITTALTWWALWRPLVMMRQVGLGGLLPESGRECEDPPGMPWRHCYRLSPLAAQGMGEQERVSLDRGTRRISQVMRAWAAPDSSAWSSQLDSLERALDRAGGERIVCPPLSASSEGVQRVAAWRFQEQDVRVLATRQPAADGRNPIWAVQVMGFPVGYSGCQSWVRERRWLSPAEAAEQMQRWLAEHAD